MQFKTAHNGFTLIEMVIVIALMGLFAVVVGPPAMKYLAGGRIRTTEANLQSINQAIESYYIDSNRYPEALKDLVRKPMDEEIAQTWRGPYLSLKKGSKDLPLDGWNRKFEYRLNEEGAETPYELYSYGAKGKGSPQSEWLFA
ncbi:MAG: type II secretion system protein GspG [Candidatus Babeliales bacterium]